MAPPTAVTALVFALAVSQCSSTQVQALCAWATRAGGDAWGAGRGCGGARSERSHGASVSAAAGLYLMEAGIVFHSVLIGVTLGVSSGPSFSTLLAALSCHQLFEGFALGAAAVEDGRRRLSIDVWAAGFERVLLQEARVPC